MGYMARRRGTVVAVNPDGCILIDFDGVSEYEFPRLLSNNPLNASAMMDPA